VAKRIIGKAALTATLEVDENRREVSRYRQIPASSGAFFLSAFQFSAFQLYPNSPFSPQPLFPPPPVRSPALSGASRRKQSPSSQPKVSEEILENAFQFAAPGSQVTIEWRESGDQGVLTISNEGPGMTKAQIEGVSSFKQFERKERENQGLGLGLFIAQQLTRRHGAAITIQSSAEGPTSVSVEFSLNGEDCQPSKA
jgi:hypothetical protein